MSKSGGEIKNRRKDLTPICLHNYCFFVFHFSYIQYSNICARVVRQALKADIRVEAAKRNESHVKFTPWTDGKPARKYLGIME